MLVRNCKLWIRWSLECLLSQGYGGLLGLGDLFQYSAFILTRDLWSLFWWQVCWYSDLWRDCGLCVAFVEANGHFWPRPQGFLALVYAPHQAACFFVCLTDRYCGHPAGLRLRCEGLSVKRLSLVFAFVGSCWHCLGGKLLVAVWQSYGNHEVLR